jgi:hypothetical protein
MKRSWVVYSKWARNNSHKYGLKKIGLFIANGQRINYTSMGWRELQLFIANHQLIIHTSMG